MKTLRTTFCFLALVVSTQAHAQNRGFRSATDSLAARAMAAQAPRGGGEINRIGNYLRNAYHQGPNQARQAAYDINWAARMGTLNSIGRR
jgi:hypothetical protein